MIMNDFLKNVAGILSGFLVWVLVNELVLKKYVSENWPLLYGGGIVIVLVMIAKESFTFLCPKNGKVNS